MDLRCRALLALAGSRRAGERGGEVARGRHHKKGELARNGSRSPTGSDARLHGEHRPREGKGAYTFVSFSLFLSLAGTVTAKVRETSPHAWHQQQNPTVNDPTSPFWTAPKSLIRDKLEVVSLVGGPQLLRAGQLLSNKGTTVPNRSHCDSPSRSGRSLSRHSVPGVPRAGLREGSLHKQPGYCVRGCS